MARILKGSEVAQAINERTARQVEALHAAGVTPTLAILRVGERPDDISYEKGARKRCESLGVAVRQVTLAADVTQEAFDRELIMLNEDSAVHGILLFRPLPPQLLPAGSALVGISVFGHEPTSFDRISMVSPYYTRFFPVSQP